MAARNGTTSPNELHRDRLFRLEHECSLSDDVVECSGRLQAAHYPIPKRTLDLPSVRRASGVPADVLIADPRNGLVLCERHHHLVDYGGLLIEREDWPVRFRGFEAQFALGWLVSKIHDRRRQTATRVYQPSGRSANIRPYGGRNDAI